MLHRLLPLTSVALIGVGLLIVAASLPAPVQAAGMPVGARTLSVEEMQKTWGGADCERCVLYNKCNNMPCSTEGAECNTCESTQSMKVCREQDEDADPKYSCSWNVQPNACGRINTGATCVSVTQIDPPLGTRLMCRGGTPSDVGCNRDYCTESQMP